MQEFRDDVKDSNDREEQTELEKPEGSGYRVPDESRVDLMEKNDFRTGRKEQGCFRLHITKPDSN